MIKNNELSNREFKTIMLDDGPQQKFKDYILKLRKQFQYKDFSGVSPSCKFLPIDLSLMMAFMFQRIIHMHFDMVMKTAVLSMEESKEKVTE